MRLKIGLMHVHAAICVSSLLGSASVYGTTGGFERASKGAKPGPASAVLVGESANSNLRSDTQDPTDANVLNQRGRDLMEGHNGKTDAVEGQRLLNLAFEAGNTDALINLGRAFLYGHGVKIDKARARRYFLKAKASGHDEASMYLSEIKGEPERGEGWNAGKQKRER